MSLAYRILIVDDHPLLREALAALVRRVPAYHICGLAGTPREATALCAEHRPDLVLLDLVLKNSDGLRLLQSLKKIRSTARVVVISQHDEAIYGLRAWRAGADGFVSKEASPETILTALAEALAGRPAFHPQVLTKIKRESRKPKRERVDPKDDTASLGPREREVFGLLGQGLSTRDIAAALNLSFRTVESHREHIKSKLSLTSAAQLNHRAALWWSQQVKS